MKYDLIDSPDGVQVLICTSENMDDVPVLQNLLDRNSVGRVHAQGQSVYIACNEIVRRYGPVFVAVTAEGIGGEIAIDPSGNLIT